MRGGGLRRRTLLGAATVLTGGPACAGSWCTEPIHWYAGPQRDRTDPFVPWACETMQLHTGLRVRRTVCLERADVACLLSATAEPVSGLRPIAWRNSLVGLTRRGSNQAGAHAFAAFLAGSTATARAFALAEPV